MTANTTERLAIENVMRCLDALAYATDHDTGAQLSIAQMQSVAIDAHRILAQYESERAAGEARGDWVMVPRVPTEAMGYAARTWQSRNYTSDPLGDRNAFYDGVYRAMIAASPTPPAIAPAVVGDAAAPGDSTSLLEAITAPPRTFNSELADAQLRAAGFSPCPTCGNGASPALPTVGAGEVVQWRYGQDGLWRDGVPTSENIDWGNHSGYAVTTRTLYSAPANAKAGDVLDTERLDWIQRESCDLRCLDMSTGQGDADIGWRVIGHRMGVPSEVIVGEVYKDDPRAAIDAAIVATATAAQECATCNGQGSLVVDYGDPSDGRTAEHGPCPDCTTSAAPVQVSDEMVSVARVREIVDRVKGELLPWPELQSLHGAYWMRACDCILAALSPSQDEGVRS